MIIFVATIICHEICFESLPIAYNLFLPYVPPFRFTATASLQLLDALAAIGDVEEPADLLPALERARGGPEPASWRQVSTRLA